MRILAAIIFWLAIAFVVYTYAGYPLIIALIAKAKKSPHYALEELPHVTLLIPAYNEEVVIGRKIKNSLELDYPTEKFQILIAVDGSDDRTLEIVQGYEDQGVEYQHIATRSGKMAAINRAVPNCRGEIIVFSDANNLYSADAITRLVQPFSSPKVGATTGSKRIIEDERELSSAEGLYWKYESSIKQNETRLGSCVAAVGEILAIRKALFSPAPINIINDDRYVVLSMLKQGYDVIYVPEAKSFEYVSLTAKDEIKRRRRMNSGGFQAIFLSNKLLPFSRPLEVWKIISHKYFRAFVPFAFIGALLSNLFLVLIPPTITAQSIWNLAAPFDWLFLVGQVLFYLIGIVGNFFKIPGKLGKIAYLPTFLINSNFAVIGGLVAYFRNKEAHLWERVNRTDVNGSS